MALFETLVGMSTITCASCGIVFGVPEHFETKRREDHASFYCPSGHINYYPGRTEAEKLRDELARQKHRTEQAEEDARRQRSYRQHAENRVRAHKGIVTKLKKRVSAGSCPCCHRKFKDLRDHMRAEHPDWDPGKGADVIASKTA